MQPNQEGAPLPCLYSLISLEVLQCESLEVLQCEPECGTQPNNLKSHPKATGM